MKISIIVPVFNEEKNIKQVIYKIKNVIRKNEYNAEIIIVDDASTDKSSEVVKKCGVTLIRHKYNKGKGECLKTGISCSSGDVLLFIDGDGQDDPSDIPKLFYQIENGADFVNGSRWLGTLEKGAISRLNYFLTFFLTLVINTFFHSSITDSQAGFRCFRKEKIKTFELYSKEYEIETEMLIKSIKKGLKIVEVPVRRLPRAHGKTKLNVIKQGLKISVTIIREFLHARR